MHNKKRNFFLFILSSLLFLFSNYALLFLLRHKYGLFVTNNTVIYVFMIANSLIFACGEIVAIIFMDSLKITNIPDKVEPISRSNVINSPMLPQRIMHDLRTALAMQEFTVSSVNDRLTAEEQKMLKNVHARFSEIINGMTK